MTTPLDLAALKRCCDEASAAPWYHSIGNMTALVAADEAVVYYHEVEADEPALPDRDKANARFVVAARNHLPALIARVEWLEKTLNAVCGDIEDIQHVVFNPTLVGICRRALLRAKKDYSPRPVSTPDVSKRPESIDTSAEHVDAATAIETIEKAIAAPPEEP